ncbi:MAG: DUF1015 family protein, partial [Proteobacteria bacterium]|nr:DUF1015 family protein [Pseudomonadota bacterium]
MTDFRPFRAWRYHPEKVILKDVIAPPYDVISGERQKALYEKSDYNCIRLILNKDEARDNDTSNRYTRARDFYNTWKQEGILVQDETPKFYVYRQNFIDSESGEKKERLALLGIFKLEPFNAGVVIPHEKTLAKPKADRKKLMDATGANLSPVFSLCEDASGSLTGLIREASDKDPL